MKNMNRTTWSDRSSPSTWQATLTTLRNCAESWLSATTRSLGSQALLRDPIERLQVIYAVPLVATGLVRRLQQVWRPMHRLDVGGITPQPKVAPHLGKKLRRFVTKSDGAFRVADVCRYAEDEFDRRPGAATRVAGGGQCAPAWSCAQPGVGASHDRYPLTTMVWSSTTPRRCEVVARAADHRSARLQPHHGDRQGHAGGGCGSSHASQSSRSSGGSSRFRRPVDSLDLSEVVRGMKMPKFVMLSRFAVRLPQRDRRKHTIIFVNPLRACRGRGLRWRRLRPVAHGQLDQRSICPHPCRNANRLRPTAWRTATKKGWNPMETIEYGALARRFVQVERTEFRVVDGYPVVECLEFTVRVASQPVQVVGHPFKILPRRGWRQRLLMRLRDDHISIQGLSQELDLAMQDMSERRAAAARTTVLRAGLAPELTFAAWDSQGDATYDADLLNELKTLKFVARHENLCIFGPSGVGKTMIAHGLGHLALVRGMNVLSMTAANMFDGLRACAEPDGLGRETARLVSSDLLIIDDVLKNPIGPDDTAAFLELARLRSATASTILVSHLDPSEWAPIMANSEAARSVLDRFLINANDFPIAGSPYRCNRGAAASPPDLA